LESGIEHHNQTNKHFLKVAKIKMPSN
jgi:hypothetical protein